MFVHFRDSCDFPLKLSALRWRFGERWAIDRHGTGPAWEAVARPTPTSLVIHVAHDLDELRVKLETEKP
jgi:hypothetical protein